MAEVPLRHPAPAAAGAVPRADARADRHLQVFDQVYLLGGGNPAKTTLTPAYLSYRTGFNDFNYGNGAAIAFMLFIIITALTLLQRYVLRDKDAIAEKRGRRAQLRGAGAR